MNLKLNSKITAAAAGLILLVMAGLGGLLYQNLDQWRKTERQIRHTRDSIRIYEELYSQVLAAESAVRAYVITASPSALPAYAKASAAVQRELLFLKRMEKEHSAQVPALQALEELLKQRKTILDESVLLRRTQGFEAVRVFASKGTGTRLSAEIDKVIREAQATERRDLSGRQEESRAASAQRSLLLTAIFIIIFLVVLAALGVVLQAARRRRLAEEELADAHERLRSVLDAADQVGIIATDLKGVITLFNKGAEKMLGYRAEEVVNLKTPALLHLSPEVEARGKELTEKLGRPVQGFDVFVETARQGGFDRREWTYVSKDGRPFPVELVVTAIKDHNGLLTGFVGLATDISSRKASQLQMRKLSAAIKASPTSIVITDKEGRIEYANPKFLELTGYTEAELLGQNPKVIASGKTPVSVYKELWDTLLAGREWQGELLNRKKSGELFWEHASISPVKDPQGNITNFVAVKLDITDRRLAQKETEKARDAAVQLARMKSEFLANMSHEIRTPMNAIIGMTGLLMDTPLTGQQRDYVRTVNGAGEALLDIINDILDFSKIESGKLLIEKMDFNLRETVEGTGDLLASRAQAKEIELAYFIEAGVPPALRGDQGRLRQVLLNLMGNAVKFVEKGWVSLNVKKVKSDADCLELLFSVKDTGIGIPTDKAGAVFEKFTQADSSTTRKYGGTGLGLPISKMLIELMGGKIWLESEPGVGTVFFFTVSLCPQKDRSEVYLPKADIKELKDRRFLVVDDNLVNRIITREITQSWGARCEGAADAQAGLGRVLEEQLAGSPFHGVFVDFNMPGMDGLEFCRRLINDPAIDPKPALAVITSDTVRLKKEEFRAIGVKTHLMKPVKKKELLDAALEMLAADRPAEAAAPQKPAGCSKEDLPPLSILIADDAADNRILMAAMLKGSKVRLDLAVDGLEALEKFRTGAYDVVFMDMQMPGMDGYEATGKIRELEKTEGRSRTRVVALTALATREDADKAIKAGCDDYLSKPIRKNTFYTYLVNFAAKKQ
ncbi:MAG TPA: hypothetical protein DEQ38_09935 [Elusimicrobia bacterium]|nr:hypothetical protein [Elusimicrobiota bacterium]